MALVLQFVYHFSTLHYIICILLLVFKTYVFSFSVSGNQMGDVGARMLAKALQINKKLKTIYWDHNGTTPTGFQYIAAALEKYVSSSLSYVVFVGLACNVLSLRVSFLAALYKNKQMRLTYCI